MLKEMIEKIEQMAATTFREVDGRTYTSKPVHMIPPYNPLPEEIHLTSLDGVVQCVKNEIEKISFFPLFLQVGSPTNVSVFSSFGGEEQRRAKLYLATPGDIPGFRDGYQTYEETMIALRSKFSPSDDVTYLLDLFSKVTDKDSVTTEDDGITQTVQINKGIALKGRESIKSIVKLRPYRTFYEVDQPESEFLVRVTEGGQIGLFEADGGAWKMKARKSIKNHFEWELRDLIKEGKVVVTL